MIEENELPQGWVWTTIGEVAETTSGGTPSRKHPEYYNGTIPWVKSGELEDNLITSVEEFITEEGYNNSNAKVFHKGTILVAMYGATVGKTGILGLDATTNQAICAISPLKNAFTSKFISYWLQSQRQTLIDQSFGGAQPNINQGIIRAFPLPLAPLPEQERIVAAIEQQFTRLDAGVAALKRAQAKLKRYRAAVLKTAVEGKLTEAWRAEHPTTEPASELLECILAERRAKWEADQRAKGKDPARMKYVEPAEQDVESLPELPEGWCWASMEQLITYLRNGLPQMPNAVSPGYRILRINAVRPMHVDLGEVRYLQLPQKDVKDYFVEDGDILFTRYNGSLELLGVAGMIQGCSSPTLHPDKLIRVKTVFAGLLPAYVTLASNVGLSRAYIESKARTTAGQKGISGGDIKQMPIPLPPLTEQEQIVAEVERRLSVISQLEATVEANLKRAERLRQSILKEAFAGRLVPQDPTDEPASALLERIRKEREERKQGMVNKGRVVQVEDVVPMQIDMKETEQAELWESVGGGE